ncbi:MAG: UDP-N-acetylmuramate dehydrogenase [Pyrinomonadaceae bacterium]
MSKPIYQENVPLAPLTTMNVGGCARYFVEVKDEESLVAVLADCLNERVFILGGGSNVVFSDSEFPGVVIRIGLKGIAYERSGGETLATSASGEDWDDFVASSVERNLAGLECLSGIPGLVGGTPVQNVGAYGQDVSETIRSVRAISRENGKLVEFDNEGCGFSYRKSVFNSIAKDRFVITSVTYGLIEGGPARIEYRDLKARFDSCSEPSLSAVRDAVCEIRASKGMLVRQGGPDSRSAGSFFKNPILNEIEFEEFCQSAVRLAYIENRQQVPSFQEADGRIKIPAAWLLEKCGFVRGYSLREAGISSRHSLAIINRGSAKSSNIIELKDLIASTVEDRLGIRLVPEPNLVGF